VTADGDELIPYDPEDWRAKPHEGTSKNYPTWHFNLVWHNDQELYNAVVEYARDLLRRVPNMDDETLGTNVKARLHSWARGWGWGYDDCLRYQHVLRHLDWRYAGWVSEVEVAESVREAIDLES
jgi:hypothetical protein